MRALLISANTERLNMPTLPLGLALVAAATRAAGHEVRYLDLLTAGDGEQALTEAVERFAPDAIGISVRNIDDQEMAAPSFLLEPVRSLVAACRELSGAPLILGGAGYSIFPDAALEWLGADLGIQGEGEMVFPRLLQSVEQRRDPGALPGVYTRGEGRAPVRSFAEDLDRLPFPSTAEWLTGIDLDDPMVLVPVQTRRGCPLHCIYCSTPRIEGRRIRRRSPAAVVEHLSELAEAGVTRLQMVDSTFNLPPSYALDLCRRISERRLGLEWRAIVYPHAVSDELAEAMAAAGCVEVSLGFETGSKSMLGPLGKRFDLDEVRRINGRFAAHGVRRFGFVMLGGPGETPSSVAESLDFAQSLELDMLKVTVGVRIYPGSPLAEVARSQGVVAANDDLLHPRFYLARGIEDCIREELEARSLAPPGALTTGPASFGSAPRGRRRGPGPGLSGRPVKG